VSGVLVLPLSSGLLLAAPAIAAEVCNDSSPAGTYVVTICISAPADGATVSGDTPVQAIATATGGSPGISRMTFRLDGQDLLVDYEAPYSFALPTDTFADGTKSLSVAATMRDGLVTPPTAVSLQFSNGLVSPPPIPTGFVPRTGTTPAPGDPYVLAATGDGASGQTSSDNVVDTVVAMDPDQFMYTGDVYDDGTYTEFKNWYGEGVRYGRLAGITNPILGNHEQTSAGWDGYARYWRSPAPYYSYDAGGWHFVVLNSDRRFGQFEPGTAQYDWLAADLAANDAACTIAGFHHPVVSVGAQGDNDQMNAMWRLLADNGVDIALTGHDHNYQRWLPMNADLAAASGGVTQFVLGGGGHGIQPFERTDARLAVGSDTVPTGYGALKLALSENGASFEYRNTAGSVLDSGTVTCTGATDTTPPTAPTGLTATASGGQVALTWDAATDNVGVDSYEIRRDGSKIAEVAGHELAYADGNVQPSTTYTYSVVAVDAAGNKSPASDGATVTTPESPGTVVLTASADTYVSSSAPGTNYGGSTVLRLDSAPDMRSYLKFDLAGISGITSMTLRVRANSNHSLGYDVKVADPGWTERGVTYADAPAPGASVGSSGPAVAGAYDDVDISSAPIAGGTLSLALTPTNSTALSLAARESATPPELVVERGSGPSNSPPVAQDVTVTTDEDTVGAWTPAVNDPDGDSLTCSITSAPSKGQASVAPDCSSGTYTPGTDQTGSDSFVYTVSDGTSTDTGSVAASVAPVNDAPVVAAASITVTEGTSKPVLLVADDVEGQCPLTFQVVTPPSHGTLGPLGAPTCTQGRAEAEVTYSVPRGYTGPDSFAVTAADPSGAVSGSRSIDVTVEPRQTSFTLTPVADSYVVSSSPTSNYGASSQLRLDTSPDTRSYLTFEVPDLTGSVVSATLQVSAGSKHSAGYRFAQSTTGWTESGITYGNAPAPGAVLGSSGPTVNNGVNEIDVTAQVTGAGKVGFVLLPVNSTSLKLWARESGRPPVLLVRTD
jgi:hypothetical protein